MREHFDLTSSQSEHDRIPLNEMIATAPLPSLDAFWMPFTDNRAFKANPRLLVSAEGMYYHSHNGQRILDGTAGLWCVNAGHGRQSITKAIQHQAGLLDFAPTFQLGHPAAFALAERLAALMPRGLDRIFFTNSGSESADTALKIALAYHRANGEAGRVRLIGRERGYHGTNMGGMSVGGIGGNRQSFGAQLWGVDHLAATHRNDAAFTKGQPITNEDMAGELERLVSLHGAESIAAVIVEPVACSTGVLVPPKGYLERLREITERYGILLIFDEVVTAFGRLGTPTAAEYFGIRPDIITLAKGLTNGAVPMGAVAASRRIYDTIIDGASSGIEFHHGYTYSGHPLAAAAGLATLDLYATEKLFERSASLIDYWENAVHSLASALHVIDVRNLGLTVGVELSPRIGPSGSRALEAFRLCLEAGLLVRVTGNVLALSPPLIVKHDQIDSMVDTIRDVLHEIS